MRQSTGPTSRFRKVFAARHVILPVVHVRDRAQAIANIAIAEAVGADGAFLIGHGISDKELLAIHAATARKFPEFFTGVNCLGASPADCFPLLSPWVRALWVDDAEIDERSASQPAAEAAARARALSGWEGLYFGGVAFKYRRELDDIAAARAAVAACAFVDVVTTSGPGTGEPAPLGKIRHIRAALANAPLAIASGITPDNVLQYVPYADCFLVATGISSSFHELAPRRVADLVATVRAYESQSRRIRKDEWHRVRMVGLKAGPVFAIRIEEGIPGEQVYGYVDDAGARIDCLEGLEDAGIFEVGDGDRRSPDERRRGRLLRVRPGCERKSARFRVRSVGEFVAEIYEVLPRDPPRLLWRDSFPCK